MTALPAERGVRPGRWGVFSWRRHLLFFVLAPVAWVLVTQVPWVIYLSQLDRKAAIKPGAWILVPSVLFILIPLSSMGGALVVGVVNAVRRERAATGWRKAPGFLGNVGLGLALFFAAPLSYVVVSLVWGILLYLFRWGDGFPFLPFSSAI